ncbi:unnamed protein product [Chrysodeixis includens]|uniref:Uncharacterized protein n=1 Tax=Chrysodeixis includens TaxID=689277 RepID=A0A9N8Q0N3_CHRIL|nr:unnamed protein product [Chrysodeixis includens]
MKSKIAEVHHFVGTKRKSVLSSGKVPRRYVPGLTKRQARQRRRRLTNTRARLIGASHSEPGRRSPPAPRLPHYFRIGKKSKLHNVCGIRKQTNNTKATANTNEYRYDGERNAKSK